MRLRCVAAGEACPFQKVALSIRSMGKGESTRYGKLHILQAVHAVNVWGAPHPELGSSGVWPLGVLPKAWPHVSDTVLRNLSRLPAANGPSRHSCFPKLHQWPLMSVRCTTLSQMGGMKAPDSDSI